MKLSEIQRTLVNLWHAKKVWRKPGKAKVLIYDRNTTEVLLTYLDLENVEIFDTRGESINIYVLLKRLLQWKSSERSYIRQYLKCIQSSVAMTSVDNDPLFYQLKSYQKSLTTVFIQNGSRGEIEHEVMQEYICNKYQVDFMLTFGNAIGRKYSEYIDGKILPIGSFKNNHYQSKTKKQFKSVLFLSQFRPPPSPDSRPMVIYDKRPIFWDQFYSAEVFLLPLLQKYCRKNKLELKICRCSFDQTNKERNFFVSLLGNENLEFTKRKNVLSSYEEIDSAGYVVFIDSTLGYEALARGKKTAAFSMRGKLLGKDDRNFGWPADLPDNGPFWTNHDDEREFERVMDYITAVSDEVWEQTRQRYVPELMEYDPGNTRFLKLMHELWVPLKSEYQENS